MLRVQTSFWNKRVHDFYSPIGWHFGHIGMTEEHWTCTRALGRPPQNEELSFLFANIPENPKDNRIHVPVHEEVTAYLAATRSRSLAALDAADLESKDPLLSDGYAWEFALQHECQHQETICELLQLIRKHDLLDEDGLRGSRSTFDSSGARGDNRTFLSPSRLADSPMISVPGGTFTMGSDYQHGYDNEKRAHKVEVAPFHLDADPVTVADWQEFIRAGGYETVENWSPEGVEWLRTTGANRPEYWLSRDGYDYYSSADGVRRVNRFEPVSSISWFEADAFARWAGKRLPTEPEWEFAAAFDPRSGHKCLYPWGDDPAGAAAVDCGFRNWGPASVASRSKPNAVGARGMAGGVWEWTSTPFLPYAGFEPFPYDGYSKDHMDGKHFVCRGGSWATDPRILRASFRNWYVPSYRQGFLGMRCAR